MRRLTQQHSTVMEQVCGGRRVGGQGLCGEYSGAAFSHDSYVMQSGALSTTASSFSHMNTLYIAFIWQVWDLFAFFLSLLHVAVLMSVWEGREVVRWPGFLIFSKQDCGAHLPDCKWEERWRDSRDQSDLFINLRLSSRQSASMSDFTHTRFAICQSNKRFAPLH